jgi:hypothetical protein
MSPERHREIDDADAAIERYEAPEVDPLVEEAGEFAPTRPTDEVEVDLDADEQAPAE